MRGGLLPAALLCLAYGLSLATAPRRAVVPGLTLFAVMALAALIWGLTGSAEIAFAGCWVSVIVLALSVYLPNGMALWAAAVLAAGGGLWAGSVLRWEGAPFDLARALPLTLVCVLARWAIERGWTTGVRVAASWLIAIAILSALLPIVETPGYVLDHRD